MLANLSQIKKQQWIRLSVLVFIAVIIVGFIFYLQEDHQPKNTKPELELKPPFQSDEANHYWQSKLEHQIDEAMKKTANLEHDLNELQQKEKPDAPLQQTINALENKIKTLESQFSKTTVVENKNNNNAQNPSGQIFPSVNQNQNSLSNPQSQTLAHSIKIDSLNDALSQQTAETYVPSGTFVKAILLSGLDASAGVTSQANPRPVLLRLLNMGHLPNRANSHLKDCFITGAGVGDVSSERAYIRLETLSCKTLKGEILDKSVFGAVVGPDGKDGIRGKIIWREGALLQRASIAGMLSGLGGGISQGFTTNQISPLGMTQSVEPNSILKMGVASGASNAMNKLAEYHIKRAEQYQPVIEIGAGTVVDVLFLKGFSWIDNQSEHDEKLPPPFEAHQPHQPNLFNQGENNE